MRLAASHLAKASLHLEPSTPFPGLAAEGAEAAGVGAAAAEAAGAAAAAAAAEVWRRAVHTPLLLGAAAAVVEE